MTKKFAELDNNGQVVNIIAAETLEDAQVVTVNKCLEVTDLDQAHIGKFWNGSEFVLEVTPTPALEG